MVQEVYATRDLGKPDWARSKNVAQAFLTDVETAAKAQVQLYEIMGANAQRFDLHAWPLFNVILHSPKLTLTALLVYLSDLTFFSSSVP